MPLIQISLVKGKSPQYLKAIGDGVHRALLTAWKIPKNDRFQILNEYKKSHFHFDKTIWGIKRSDDVIVIYQVRRNAPGFIHGDIRRKSGLF